MLLDVGSDNARAGNVVTVLGSVRAGPTLLGDTALVDQVNDQLHLVADLEVGHLRLVAGLNQGLETVLDQLGDTAAKHGLLTE